MKLKDILNGSDVHITYRTMYKGQDILGGFCYWNGRDLLSEDGDNYSLEDEISRYAWTSGSDLTVWYESKWIEG